MDEAQNGNRPAGDGGLRGVARATAAVGAVVSVTLMAYGGRHNPSRLLVLLFAAWVLSPFAAFFAADASRRMRTSALHAVVLAMTALSVAIYGAVVLNVLQAKIGFVFLVVPGASWLLLALSALTVALTARSR